MTRDLGDVPGDGGCMREEGRRLRHVRKLAGKTASLHDESSDTADIGNTMLAPDYQLPGKFPALDIEPSGTSGDSGASLAGCSLTGPALRTLSFP